MFARPTLLLRGATRAFSAATGTAPPTTLRSAAATLLGCSGAAYLVDQFIVTDDLVNQLQTSMRDLVGGMVKIAVPTVQAFATPDHGLHPAHQPWESDKWYKTYDHAA